MENYPGMSVSFAIGLALSTNKRVFVFVGEGDLLRELSVVGQAAVSACTNLFIIILDNDCYQDAGNLPTMFNSFLSRRGIFFNFGCMVHDFTANIKNRYLVELRAAVERIRGPMVILVSVDKGTKRNLSQSEVLSEDKMSALKEFVRDESLESALYEPPIWLSSSDQEINSINIGEISGGIS